jgi:hypothetical protein
MHKTFSQPYIIFYPVISKDGMAFPINQAIRAMQEEKFDESVAWRGDIIIAKFCNNPFTSMINASMADFPLVKNFFQTARAPGSVVGGF